MTSASPSRLSADQLPQALEAVLRQRIPTAHAATISNWRPAEQGFSTETYLFDLVGVESSDATAAGTAGLVFRRPPDFAVLPDFDLRRQYLVMQRLANSPVPVPKTRWIDAEGTDLGTPYFVMDRIDDVISVSDVPSYHQEGVYAETDDDGRARLWNGCVDLIARVHQIDTAERRLGFLDLRRFGTTPPQRLVNFLRYALDWAGDGNALHPGLARALDWADNHMYEPTRVALCWGDSRMSNVLYSGTDHHPVAALDWEIAYLGDPGADLAWMFLTDWVSSPLDEHASLHGTPSREETLERYAGLTGWRPTNMLFNDVTAALLLAVPLIRLNKKLNLEGVDLADICAQRVAVVLDGS
ncbi:phosphotransferase family protein [Nocardia sp. 348MFTsu5.1]|uniref:phosphotransferase family protein n=1 Tax=Nocardia sp. 348MFTsu5.1 TaxID=1172185 RepID=UPI000367D758|nr:phosphotransferase family protein [Nocardia sp. 348MFTsu5.1]